jgi:hypothetical protein
VFIDDGDDLDRSTVGGGVELKSTAHTLFGASAAAIPVVVLAPTRLRRRRSA